MKESSLTTCHWCKERVCKRLLQRHFFEECDKRPDIPPNHGVCSMCRSIKPAEDFPKDRDRVTGLGTWCKKCHLAYWENYRSEKTAKGIKTGGDTRTDGFKARPGRWVVKPCQWCGEMFRHYEWLKHKARCPKRPPRADGKRACFVPPVDVVTSTIETTEERERRLHRNWKGTQLKRYGITMEDFDRMLAEQGGVCSICGKPPGGEEVDKKKRVLHVDHDHAIGEKTRVRGLLCYICNHGIGNFLDDPMNLAKAILYLRRYQHVELLPIIHFLEQER